ncbi:hypothetical protein ACIGC1_24975, partial [Peribacillus butanolivorans]|uniref:hypothetical protein n=1 Tax=Peribacillus butanolivorans TaxID=421767 RepID=UPI0037C77164
MEVIIERVCGMDVHKNNITAYIITAVPERIFKHFSKKLPFAQLTHPLANHAAHDQRCTTENENGGKPSILIL